METDGCRVMLGATKATSVDSWEKTIKRILALMRRQTFAIITTTVSGKTELHT